MFTHNSPPCHSALLRRPDQIASIIFPLSDEVGNIQFSGNSNSQSALRVILALGRCSLLTRPKPGIGAHSSERVTPAPACGPQTTLIGVSLSRSPHQIDLIPQRFSPYHALHLPLSLNFPGDTRLRRSGPAGPSVSLLRRHHSGEPMAALSRLSAAQNQCCISPQNQFSWLGFLEKHIAWLHPQTLMRSEPAR
jgi:hypothetical protein